MPLRCRTCTDAQHAYVRDTRMCRARARDAACCLANLKENPCPSQHRIRKGTVHVAHELHRVATAAQARAARHGGGPAHNPPAGLHYFCRFERCASHKAPRHCTHRFAVRLHQPHQLLWRQATGPMVPPPATGRRAARAVRPAPAAAGSCRGSACSRPRLQQAAGVARCPDSPQPARWQLPRPPRTLLAARPLRSPPRSRTAGAAAETGLRNAGSAGLPVSECRPPRTSPRHGCPAANPRSCTGAASAPHFNCSGRRRKRSVSGGGATSRDTVTRWQRSSAAEGARATPAPSPGEADAAEAAGGAGSSRSADSASLSSPADTRRRQGARAAATAARA
jgi:hypothetical protein